MENNQAHIKRSRMGDGQILAPMDQDGPRPRQCDSSSVQVSAASSQQLGIPPKQHGRTGQDEEEAEEGRRKQIQQPGQQVTDQIQTLEQQVINLQMQLDKEKQERDYYRRKTMEFYKKLCTHDPVMFAEYQRRVRTALRVTNANAAPRPSAPISLTTVHPVLRPPAPTSSPAPPSSPDPPSSPALPSSPAPPSSPAVNSVPPPSTPLCSANIPASPRQSAPHPSTALSVPRSSTALPLTEVSSAPRQATVLSPSSSCRMPTSASPVAASALHIDLTLEETPPSSPPSENRKRALEQESQAGYHLRKKILTKTFEWMEPKDRPNFKKRNPYKPEPTSLERPLEIDSKETEKPYPEDSLQFDHNLGQTSQEPPLTASQAPAHPPASAKLLNPQKNKPSKPRTRKPNNEKAQATTMAQQQDEGRERMETTEEQNATAAEKTQEQEAEDYGAMEAERRAILEEGAEDIDTRKAEIENSLEEKMLD